MPLENDSYSNSSTQPDEDILSLSGSESTVNLNDIDLLTSCTREDLFNLIREDPEYYLTLIKDNGLENQLNILVRRSDNGNGLHIKFKIYSDDRWTEVGYWDDCSDQEVYQDFADQVKILLTQSRSGRKAAKYSHLESQLDADNNMLSPEYGNDIKQIREIKQKFKSDNQQSSFPLSFSPSQEQRPPKSQEPQLNQAQLIPNVARARLAPENLKDELDQSAEEKPVDFLNSFVAQLLEKIIEKVPQLVNIDKNRNYHLLAKNLNDLSLFRGEQIPENYTETHNKLVDQIRGCHYIQKIHYLTDWEKFPELNDYLVDFHRSAMKLNPSLYTKIEKQKLIELLDQDDQEILKTYCLDIQQIWLDYLNHQD